MANSTFGLCSRAGAYGSSGDIGRHPGRNVGQKIEPAEYRLYRDERSSSDVDEFWDLGISNDYSYLSLLTLDAILVEIHPCLEKETSHNTA